MQFLFIFFGRHNKCSRKKKYLRLMLIDTIIIIIDIIYHDYRLVPMVQIH